LRRSEHRAEIDNRGDVVIELEVYQASARDGTPVGLVGVPPVVD